MISLDNSIRCTSLMMGQINDTFFTLFRIRRCSEGQIHRNESVHGVPSVEQVGCVVLSMSGF